MKLADNRPLSRAEFHERLRRIGAERYHDRHPFHARLHGGECSPDEVRAWRLGGETFIRTRHTLMSPPWSATENGEGDMRIYALPSTPFVLLHVNGRTVSAQLND